MKYVKPEKISLRGHPQFDERWVQARIAEDPSILGLGPLILKDKERLQSRAGRLDLLLQDPEAPDRYEVEVQLGATNEAHIIRTIEYWDVERKLYPQYEHRAVLVAEDITSRFFNVIGLFNMSIPIIAIQMQALQIEDKVSLSFVTLLNAYKRGMVDEDEEVRESTDRAYWEVRASKESVALADRGLQLVQEVDPGLELKYNKFYIGLARDGDPFNFIVFRPKTSFLRIEPRIEQNQELQMELEQSGLDIMGYDERWGRYRIRVTEGDLEKHRQLLVKVIKRAYEEASTR